MYLTYICFLEADLGEGESILNARHEHDTAPYEFLSQAVEHL